MQTLIALLILLFSTAAYAIPQKDPVRVCQKNIQCRQLAEVVVWEARGESDHGKIATGWGVVNRVLYAEKDTTIRKVVRESGQFSYLADWRGQRAPDPEDWVKAYQLAYGILNGDIASNIGRAEFYHIAGLKSAKRKWFEQKLKRVARVDNQIFYERPGVRSLKPRKLEELAFKPKPQVVAVRQIKLPNRA